jgi:hypothetical protein
VSFFHPIKDPVQGTAHVVGVSAVDPQFMRQPCTMQLVIQAEGIEAFPVRQDFAIWTNQWPDPGQLLPVTFDREHHDRIEIHWDQVQTSTDTAAQDAEALAAQLNAGPGAAPGAGAPAPLSSAPAPQPAADPLDRLEKLAELHSSGALTDEEFAAQKAKILGST